MTAFQCASARRSSLETVPPPQEIRAAQGATCTGRFVSNANKNQNSQMGRRASHLNFYFSDVLAIIHFIRR